MLYFFNKAGVIQDPDDEGCELASIADARLMAVRFAAETIRDEPHLVWKGKEFRVEVTDESQDLLFKILVTGVDAPDV